MNKTIVFLLLCFCFGLPQGKAQQLAAFCGDDRLGIIDLDRPDDQPVDLIWNWNIKEVLPQLPEGYDKYLYPLDECKFVDNNRKLLITSSGNAALLLDIATKQCLFYAKTPMAHSAEMLPGNLIAVALSTHPEGNSIELFDASQPEKVLFRDSLYSGHGVVWDAVRNQLYALGYSELRAYTLTKQPDGNPELTQLHTWIIPVTSGHDLVQINPDELLISGHEGVCRFNLNSQTFSPFEPLATTENVKSVNYNESTGRLLYTKAEKSWWTHHIYQENPDKCFTIDSVRVYKVRPAVLQTD